MSPFAGYLLGLLIIVGGLAFAAVLLNVPPIAVALGVALTLFAIGAWATRRPRPKASKFTGERHAAPSLEPTVLMELKTTLMEQPDASRTARTTVLEQDRARTQPTTRMPRPNEAQTEATTRLDQSAGTQSRPKTTPPDERGPKR